MDADYKERMTRVAKAKNMMALSTYASTTPNPYTENRASARANRSRLRKIERAAAKAKKLGAPSVR